MKTRLEKNLSDDRIQSQGILVPKLNELLKSNIGIDDEDDAKFLYWLSMKQVQREEERKRGNGVYSPSGLASCLRRVYLSKNWKELGFERVSLPAISPHFYFLTGDFIHLKWQFAMWKLSQIDPDFLLIDCEIGVMSKRGDHGGTIDVLAVNDGELIIVDVKGLNVRSFMKVDAGEIQPDYKIQVGDYMMLWNSGVRHRLLEISPELRALTGWDEFPRVTTGIVLAENKGGPDHKHPAALTEYVVKSKDSLPEVRARLEVLRNHEEEGTLPPIECVSTRGIQFESCPFAEACRKEIRKTEREAAKDRHTKEHRLAKPKRSDRPRRPGS